MCSNQQSPLEGEYGNTQHKKSPSPDASIIVLNPSDNSKDTKVTAIFDSAAVMTCIPEIKLDGLGRLDYSCINLRGVNNTTIERKTYVVNIQLGDYFFANIEVIAIPKDYALIGRDILNLEKVTLNAPERKWIYNCQTSCSIHTQGT